MYVADNLTQFGKHTASIKQSHGGHYGLRRRAPNLGCHCNCKMKTTRAYISACRCGTDNVCVSDESQSINNWRNNGLVCQLMLRINYNIHHLKYSFKYLACVCTATGAYASQLVLTFGRYTKQPIHRRSASLAHGRANKITHTQYYTH